MSKELESLKRCKTVLGSIWPGYNKIFEEDFGIIEQGLKRLEQIDNANPSEALKDLKDLKDYLLRDRVNISSTKYYNTIEQALLKVPEQEKVLKIIFEKKVNFEVFGAFETYEDYEIYYNKKVHLIEQKLTEEEFYLLKRMGGE